VLAIATVCELYRVDSDAVMAGSERLLQFGGVGTPLLGEFVLGAIGPQATNAAGLDAEAADWVDSQVAVALAYQPIGRVLGQVAGWVVQADPALAAESEAERSASRDVRFSPLTDGHTDLWGRLDAADGLLLDQALDTVADDLAAVGIAGGRDVLRSTALGVLARTALGQDPLGLTRAAHPPHATDSGPTSRGTLGTDAREARRAVLHIHLTPDAITDGIGVATIDGWDHSLLTVTSGEDEGVMVGDDVEWCWEGPAGGFGGALLVRVSWWWSGCRHSVVTSVMAARVEDSSTMALPAA